MIKRYHKIMAGPIGTIIKGFITACLTLWLAELQNGHQLFSGDWAMIKKLMTGAMASTIPVIINWLNPAYKNYGK